MVQLGPRVTLWLCWLAMFPTHDMFDALYENGVRGKGPSVPALSVQTSRKLFVFKGIQRTQRNEVATFKWDNSYFPAATWRPSKKMFGTRQLLSYWDSQIRIWVNRRVDMLVTSYITRCDSATYLTIFQFRMIFKCCWFVFAKGFSHVQCITDPCLRRFCWTWASTVFVQSHFFIF